MWARSLQVLVLCLVVVTTRAASAAIELTHADFVMQDGDIPPPDDAPWSPVELPDRWSERIPEAHGSGWYRLRVGPLGEGDPKVALYLPKLNMNAEAFVSGRWVGSGGSFVEPVTQNWNRPLLFRFDRSLVADGGWVHIRIYGYRGDWGGLGPVWLGDEAELSPRYEHQYLLQVVPSQVASVVSLLMIALFTALWLSRDRDPLYGFFVLATASYFIHGLSGHLRDIVVPYYFGRWLIHATIDWFAVWMIFSTHRWLHLTRPRLERFAVAAMLLGSITTAIVGAMWFLRVALVFHILAAVTVPYALLEVARRWHRLPRPEAHFVLVAAVSAIVVIVHALLIQLGVLPQDAPRLLHLLAPSLLLAFGSVMLADFMRSYRTARRLNAELEQRVRDKEAELADNYASLRRLEHQRLLAEERERIMREMHDGMGSSLVSTLSLVERSNAPTAIATAIRDALVDMRVVIDSLDPSADDLLAMLGMLRTRLEPKLRARGVSFAWKVRDVPSLEWLGPREMLHVMRVVQEAITNTLKHTRATTITIATAAVERDGRPGVLVSVADDGRGSAEGRGGGRGLPNMRFRAEQLGGTLAIHHDGGVCVELWLPLESTIPSSRSPLDPTSAVNHPPGSTGPG
ncbi:MAG: hypothetical protein KC731_38885 [Myxococcales bacterium]|nr:hypothetical protein [Myxococcales bacterium]